MTLAVAIVTWNAVLVAADRKLSGNPRLKGFDATKLIRIQTTDSHGVMSYAGVGANLYTKPFEVSTWLERVLRGYVRSHSDTMQEIAKAATEQGIATRLKDENGRPQFHDFMFAGFLDGAPIIDHITSQNLGPAIEEMKKAAPNHFAILRTWVPPKKYQVFAIGSGSRSLSIDRTVRRVGKYLKRSGHYSANRRRASALLSMIVRAISEKHIDVSRECICCWTSNSIGGEFWIYDADGRLVQDGQMVPSVAHGVDSTEMMNRLRPVFDALKTEWMRALDAGLPVPTLDEEAVRAAVAKVDLTPKKKF